MLLWGALGADLLSVSVLECTSVSALGQLVNKLVDEEELDEENNVDLGAAAAEGQQNNIMAGVLDCIFRSLFPCVYRIYL